MTLSLYLYSRAISLEGKNQGWVLFFTALCLGMVPFAKLQAAPIAFGMGVFLIAWLLIRRNSNLKYLIAGALVPLVILAVYLLVADLVNDFWSSYIMRNITYAERGLGGRNLRQTFLNKLGKFPNFLLEVHDTRYFFITHITVILMLSTSVFWVDRPIS